MATETYELRVEGHVNTEFNEVVMHFTSDNVTANATEVNGASLIDSWNTNILAAWRGLFPGPYVTDRLAARRAFPKPSYVSHLQYARGTKTGLAGGEPATTNLCPVVFLIPPMGVKSGGKVFLPCVKDTWIVNNIYDPAFLTAVDTCFNLMIANFGVSGIHWQMSVFSRKLLQAHNVLAYQMSPRLGFQGKRRLPL